MTKVTGAYTAVAADDVSPLTVPLAKEEGNDSRTWTDTYFENKVSADDLVAVFDVNYDGLKQKLNYTMVFFVLFWIYMIWILVPLYLNDGSDGSRFMSLFWFVYCGFMLVIVLRAVHRQKKVVNGLHVAVTRQGIRKDMNHFPFAALFHTSTMMPFEEISKIFVRRVCCGACGKGQVHVIAAADQTQNIIQDLEDPDGFVELVKRMMEEKQKQSDTSMVDAAKSDSPSITKV
ncbi:hypothetical protein ACA910_011346 [Epithemia clementina (nom. ined.)]